MHNQMIPGSPSTWYVEGDDLTGLNAFDQFVDARGRVYRLLQVHTVLTNNAFAAGEVAVFLSAQVITNDVSIGIDATSPVAAGVIGGALAESTSATATAAGAFYCLVLVDGRYTAVVTDAGGDIAASDLIVADPNTDGAVDKLAPTSLGGSIAEQLKLIQSLVGWALTDDTATHVDAYVRVRF